MKITQYLSGEQIQELTVLSDWKGWRAVIFDWGMIALALFCCARFPFLPVIVLSMIVIGGRQLGLAILVHETTHRSLFKTRALNEWVGRWLCGAPIWQDLPRYREHHMKHHQFAGSPDDPDLSLVKPFPVTPNSLARKLIRDVLGITGLKRLYGLFLIDFGFLTYTIAADPKRIDQTGRKFFDVLAMGIKNMFPVLLSNFLLFIVFYFLGKPWLYAVWLGSYLTAFSVFLRIRSIAEHACTKMDLDPVQNTRTTLANPLARLTIAPHRVNFHLEHHLVMMVPYFSLPKLHRQLKDAGALENAFVARGYIEILIRATRSIED